MAEPPALPAALNCSGTLSATDGFTLHCASAVAAAATAALPSAQAIAHKQLAFYVLCGIGGALPLLFFVLALARSTKFRREFLRDPWHVLYKGEDMIVAALGDDDNLKSLARAILHSLLLPLLIAAVALNVADSFMERDLVPDLYDYAQQIIHIHPQVTALCLVGVPSAVTGIAKSIIQNASFAHGLSFHIHDIIDFPQISGLSVPGASPPGMVVMEINALVKLLRLCDEVVVRPRPAHLCRRRRRLRKKR